MSLNFISFATLAIYILDKMWTFSLKHCFRFSWVALSAVLLGGAIKFFGVVVIISRFDSINFLSRRSSLPLSSSSWRRRHRRIYSSTISRSADNVTGCIVFASIPFASIFFLFGCWALDQHCCEGAVGLRDKQHSCQCMLILKENGYLNKLNIVDSNSFSFLRRILFRLQSYRYSKKNIRYTTGNGLLLK